MSEGPGQLTPLTWRPVRTERLVLRMMTLDDVDDVHAYQSIPEVCEYLLFEPRTREVMTEKIAEWSQSDTLAATGDYVELAIELPGADGDRNRVIGHIYFTISDANELTGEIGWSLHPAFEGRGFASEAANAMLDVAFGELGLHRVYAELDVRNTASVALCRRLGMREEALFREHMWFKGAWSDTGIHAILDHEWRALRGGTAG